ncbi:PTS fructose transporter subunit IIA [Fibrobacterales bacterium]|nr:PTS fructose transporter subunit IIA [Fibrobacterales bacterium]
MYNVIRLSERLSEKHIIIHSASTNAENILREMVGTLSEELGSEVCEDVATAVFSREKQKSTGIGYGVAVPHARISSVKQLYCVVATSENGIEFKALDGKSVHLFFLIISPDSTVGPHLNIISAISHLVGKNAKICEAFNKAFSPAEFMEILRKEEEKYIG